MQSNLNTMAVNENAAGRSGDVSDLLNGWSFVVHHPSEDPEPANLPSTVDMAAFSAGPNEQQSHDPDTQQCSDSESDSASDSENSGSDASWSGSTSDSESSSSSQCSAHSNPSQFNLTSMQTGGLKLKIAAVRKSCDSPEKDKPDNDDEKPIYETTSANNTTKNVTSDRSSDSESDCSDSDSSTDTESQSTTAKSDTSESKQDKKGRTAKPVKNVVKSAVSVKNNVSAQKKSAPLSKSHRISSRNGNKSKTNQANANKTNISTKENSDSDEKSDSDADSVMLASCSLQEIRQEDLAAILPDQQDCDAFGVFECETRSNKNLINETADASGSDMELPPQLVTAAIQRATECTSDGESSCPPQPTLYASSLLQQFEVQTQMLSTTPAQGNTPANITSLITDNISSSSQNNTSAENVKRKRGRPKKNQKPVEEGSGKAQNKSNIARNAILGQEYCSKSNVSPDSGIQDSPERPSSPEPNVLPSKNNDKIKSVKSSEKNNKNLKKDSIYEYTEEKKCDIKLKSKTLPRPHLDRVLYANTDRVLYPPRRRVGRPPSKKFRRPGRPPKLKSNESSRNSQSLVEVPSEISRKSNINKELQKKLIKKSNKSGSKHYKLKNQQRKDHKIVDGSEQKVVINKKSESKKMIDYVPSKTTNHIVYLPSKSNNDSRNRNISSTVKIRKRPTYATHIRIKSKHKHHKHHKHRLKSHRPKPSQEDPKLLSEIDKLIADFIKFCSVGTNRNIMEKVAESIKCVKRASKKRKGSDNLEGRKKKKQCNVSNESESKGEHSSNEQRLPLKKRHYHISNGENKQSDTTTEPSRDSSDKSIVNVSTEEDIENKNEEKQKIVSEVDSKSTAESKETGKSTDTHIKEAIEACINRYNPTMTAQKNIHSVNSGQSTLKDVTLNQVQPNEPTKTNINIKGIMATTPKKRHRLETEIGVDKSAIDKTLKNLNISLNSQSNEKQIKLETKSNNNTESLQGNKKTPMKTPETIAQIKTRKKNRLEDLTSNLASKITPSSEALDSLMINNQKKSNKKPTSTDIKSDATVNRASVIKSPSVKKEERSEFDGNIVSDIPTGIFMPTVDIELQIPASTIINTSCELPKVQGTSQININCDTGVHNLRNKKINESVKSTTKIAKHGITKKEAEKETKKIEKETKKIEKETKKVEKEIKVQIEKTSKGNTEKNNARSVEKENDIKKPLPIEVATNETEKERSDKSKQYESQQKRIRRRKAINRTGFPTVKKKKKKLITPSDNKDSTAVSKNNQNVYERVPKIGEKASTFVERTQKTRLTSIEKENENDKSERNESKSKFNLDLKSSNTYSRDNSPCSDSRPTRRRKSREPEESILKASERISRKIRDQSNDSLKSSDTSVSSKSRIKRKRNSLSRTSDLMYKKRLRDFSPASSIEPLPSDKRIRCDESASASGDDTRRSRKPPRWRKKYLVAGLFSDYFKEDDETARIRRAEASATKTKLIYKPEEHPHGLLPPPYHCGKWLRCRKTYFQLPHDLWWQHTHSRLPGRDLVPSWNYRKIRTNVYCTRPVNGVCEPQACNCSESTGCGDDCINRLVLSECPATHRCKNQKIQRHEWAPGLDKFMTEDKGWGVKTKLPIKSGEFILEYVGEVVSDKEFKHRMASRYAHDTHHYCLHLDGGLVIDGHRMGGDGRFVNHSCEPNCEMQKWSVNGQFRMALFALRDIEADEELTYDYNFSLFNPADGQVCKCGSDNCRGVIGGKSQRVKQPASESHSNSNGSGRIGRPRKNRARRTTSGSKDSVTEKNSTAPAIPSHPGSAAILPNIKPLTQQQKALVLERHCFLIKNLNKIKQMRERSLSIVARSTTQNVSENNHVGAFLSHLNALRQPRNIKTRRLAQAEENPELSRAARLASVFRDLYNAVVNAKDEKNQLFSTPFMTLPTKRKQPEYYQRVSDPIDLSTIHQNIENGKYPTVEKFDSDVSRVFDNAVKYFGRTSELGIAATRLRKVYGEAKVGCVEKLKEILGEKPPVGFVASQDPGAEEEDVIRCICGLYRDEGLMIQCERCLVWQHCECVKADEKAPSYLCERCQPRNVDYEIPLNEFTEHGHRFYMSLMRKDLQLRQGDTVYVLRDISIEGTNRKHTYETIGDIDFTELDIFRIERLWKDKDTGQRMAYGHHYLRPHETYHEPTRKFFPNEVMRVPLYEAVPVELIMSRCWVMDINTFCKGRPMGAPEEHIYVCEYRVDKSARLFTKMTKTAYPICTKNYAFERFETRLKISRSYAPHELENAPVKVRGKRQTEEIKIDTKNLQVHMPVMRSLAEQKTRLNSILLKLLANLPTKQPLDVSYLLEGGRRRKKPQS